MMNKINKININSIVADKWFEGEIIKGRGQGRTLGFPTLNIELINSKTPKLYKSKTLKFGVYSCKVKINNQVYRGLLHYGPRPTFSCSKPGLEIYVLDFDKEIKPGEKIQFKLLKHLRKIKKFKNKEDLIKQIRKDKNKTIQYFSF